MLSGRIRPSTYLALVAALGIATPAFLPAHADESTLTAKIKARLATQYYSSSSHIQVKTDAEGIVWLTGTAPTSDASSLAADVAKNTDGVTVVHNQIRVR
jgi:hyperosmotically inducible protein